MVDYRIDPQGIRPGYPLSKLGRSGASNGQVPVWNATTGQWEPGSAGTGVVASVVAGSGVSVDSTDPAHPIVSATGSGAETYDQALAAITGAVHRWKFDETSGASCADSVGSLPLTLTGTFTRNITTPLGKGVTLGGGYAASSGLGSVPVGAAARTIVMLCRVDSVATTQHDLFGYGGNTDATNFGISLNVSANRPNLQRRYGTTGAFLTKSFSDGVWMMVAHGYTPLTLAQPIFANGDWNSPNIATATNTTASGNFYAGNNVALTNPAAGDIDDLVVFNRWIGIAAVSRLWQAFCRNVT